MKLLISFLLVAWSIGSALVFCQESSWRAAVAKIDITPTEPIFLAGYASRDKPFENIEAPLYAKAVAFTDPRGHRAVLITTDLIGFTSAVSNPICEGIIEKTGIERAQILINSSHTHTGPGLTLDPAPTGKRDAAESARQVAYTKELQEKIIALAVDVLAAESKPVELSWGTGIIHFVMNRREFTETRGVRLGVNPRGPVDRSVPVLKIDLAGKENENEEENLLAVIYQAACHNTTLGGRYFNVTGDFAGYSQARIEKEFPGVQAMFMTGCGGDANPYPRDNKIETSRRHGIELAEAVASVLRGKRGQLKPVAGPLRTAFSVTPLPLEPLPAKKQLSEMRLQSGGWRGWAADQFAKYHEPDSEPFPKSYPAAFGVWQFGDDDLTLVALSGEVVVDYVQIIERTVGPLNLWISAYCNDVYGYLPSARVLREGGYETRGLYHGIGFFRPEVEEAVAGSIRKLCEQTKRPRMPELERP